MNIIADIINSCDKKNINAEQVLQKVRNLQSQEEVINYFTHPEGKNFLFSLSQCSDQNEKKNWMLIVMELTKKYSIDIITTLFSQTDDKGNTPFHCKNLEGAFSADIMKFILLQFNRLDALEKKKEFLSIKNREGEPILENIIFFLDFQFLQATLQDIKKKEIKNLRIDNESIQEFSSPYNIIPFSYNIISFERLNKIDIDRLQFILEYLIYFDDLRYFNTTTKNHWKKLITDLLQNTDFDDLQKVIRFSTMFSTIINNIHFSDERLAEKLIKDSLTISKNSTLFTYIFSLINDNNIRYSFVQSLINTPVKKFLGDQFSCQDGGGRIVLHMILNSHDLNSLDAVLQVMTERQVLVKNESGHSIFDLLVDNAAKDMEYFIQATNNLLYYGILPIKPAFLETSIINSYLKEKILSLFADPQLTESISSRFSELSRSDCKKFILFMINNLNNSTYIPILNKIFSLHTKEAVRCFNDPCVDLNMLSKIPNDLCIQVLKNIRKEKYTELFVSELLQGAIQHSQISAVQFKSWLTYLSKTIGEKKFQNIVSQITKEGSSVIHFAIEKSSDDQKTINLLRFVNIDKLSLLNKDNQTPFQLAESCQKQTMINYIKSVFHEENVQKMKYEKIINNKTVIEIKPTPSDKENDINNLTKKIGNISISKNFTIQPERQSLLPAKSVQCFTHNNLPFKYTKKIKNWFSLTKFDTENGKKLLDLTEEKDELFNKKYVETQRIHHTFPLEIDNLINYQDFFYKTNDDSKYLFAKLQDQIGVIEYRIDKNRKCYHRYFTVRPREEERRFVNIFSDFKRLEPQLEKYEYIKDTVNNKDIYIYKNTFASLY